MKIISFCDDEIILFATSSYIDLKKIEDDDLPQVLKELLIKLNTIYQLSLKGYYHMSIYQHDDIGSFFVLEKIDDLEFSSRLIDLKITIYLDSQFYFETEDFDLLANDEFYINNQMFYQDASLIDDKKWLNIIERVNFIYGIDIFKIKSYPKLKKEMI